MVSFEHFFVGVALVFIQQNPRDVQIIKTSSFANVTPSADDDLRERNFVISEWRYYKDYVNVCMSFPRGFETNG